VREREEEPPGVGSACGSLGIDVTNAAMIIASPRKPAGIARRMKRTPDHSRGVTERFRFGGGP